LLVESLQVENVFFTDQNGMTMLSDSTFTQGRWAGITTTNIGTATIQNTLIFDNQRPTGMFNGDGIGSTTTVTDIIIRDNNPDPERDPYNVVVMRNGATAEVSDCVFRDNSRADVSNIAGHCVPDSYVTT
jgi:hypothetical protein